MKIRSRELLVKWITWNC